MRPPGARRGFLRRVGGGCARVAVVIEPRGSIRAQCADPHTARAGLVVAVADYAGPMPIKRCSLASSASQRGNT